MTLEIFRYSTFALFFIYIFFETKTYLTLWIAILCLIIAYTALLPSNIIMNKIIIAAYVILVGASYLFVFRDVLSGKKMTAQNSKWENLSKDKNKQHRIGIAALIWLVINVAAIFF
jgi:hypothetical protein